MKSQEGSLRGLVGVLGDPAPLLVADPEVELRARVVLLGGLREPARRASANRTSTPGVSEQRDIK